MALASEERRGIYISSGCGCVGALNEEPALVGEGTRRLYSWDEMRSIEEGSFVSWPILGVICRRREDQVDFKCLVDLTVCIGPDFRRCRISCQFDVG